VEISGKSVREIPNITNVPRSTVSRILLNEKRNKSLHRKRGCGPNFLNDKLRKILNKDIEEFPILTARKQAIKIKNITGENIKKAIMVNYIKSLGFKS
ncbi:hypothetical protein H312_03022, partial [Anncaliia algerae PRA339]